MKPAAGRPGRGRLLLTIAALAVLAAVVGWQLGSRARGRSAQHARTLFERGTAEDLAVAADILAAGRGECQRSAEALARAQLWAEFGAAPELARDAASRAQVSRSP